MSKHRIAVIGAGMAVTPHAQSLVDLAARVDVAGVYSANPDRRRAFAAKFPFPVTGDLDALVADRSVDAALVLAPPQTHVALVERLAAAGKHVLIEKPLAVDAAGAAAAVTACANAGVTLAVVLQHRFRPAARALAALLAAGALGEVAGGAVSVRWWRPQSYYDEPGRGTLARDGGGVLLTQAIHTLDLALSLLPAVVEVTAYTATSALHRMETEDSAAGAARLANGALVALDATTASYPGFPERIEIIGTRGTAVLTAGLLDVYHADGRRETAGEAQATGGGADPMAFTHDAHRAVHVEFLDALDARRPPVNSGRSALAAHRVIDALLASSRQRVPIAIAG